MSDSTKQPATDGPAYVLRLTKSGACLDLHAGQSYSIGSDPEADLKLSGDDFVSRRHAWIRVLQGGTVELSDGPSRNGTFVNSQLVTQTGLRVGDRVMIGDTELVLEGGTLPAASAAPKPKRGPASHDTPVRPPRTAQRVSQEPADSGPLFAYRGKVHEKVVQWLLKCKPGDSSDEQRQALVESLLDQVMGEDRPPRGVARAEARRTILRDLTGMGPIEPLLQDDDIEEIMVNSEDVIYVASHGRIKRIPARFLNRTQLMNVIEKIVTPLGKQIDEATPRVDATLPDGSRVNAIIPPLALAGPCVTIRKFRKSGFTAQDLIDKGAINERMLAFFQLCVANRLNILISGGTGSGKTTMLNMFSSFIPPGERIVTIEDTPELRLMQDHVVRLQTRTANIEGRGEVSIRDLVINALRMRPDRIVVGECRGGEALDMIQAMNTGHDGSLTTAHANSPRDALRRLEVMCLMSGMQIPMEAVREQIASAINVVVQIARFFDGSRRVVSVAEVTGIQSGNHSLHEIFEFRREGFDADGNVKGAFACTGAPPPLVDSFAEMGVSVDRGLFREGPM